MKTGRQFWVVIRVQTQREFIVSHIVPIKTKYRYSTTKEYRNLNSDFYFDVNNTCIRVCNVFLKSTLDINDRPIRTELLNKLTLGLLIWEEKWETSIVGSEIKDSIRRYINNISRIESHYLRAQISREFLESDKV